MARYVTVSSVVAKCPDMPRDWTHEMRVAAMMRHWETAIAPVLPDRPDLIVLPEACDRYNYADAAELRAYYDVRGDRMRDFFADMAKKNGCHIAYSAARRAEDGFFRNSTQLIGPDGQVKGIYNKNHLVVTEGVQDGPLPMKCGKDAPVFELDFGRVGCAICFDLNFDALRRRYKKEKQELLLFSSMYHGGLMQPVWAYDCRSWFVSAVCGQEARVISPVGETVACSTNYFPYVTAKINLDYAVCHLDFNWDKFAAAKAKYGSKVGFFDPGRLGAVLLTSESDEFSVRSIIEEFGIEVLDDYFDRSLAHQRARTEE